MYLLTSAENALVDLLSVGLIRHTGVGDPMQDLRLAVKALCLEVLPNAIGLTDAFGFSDWSRSLQPNSTLHPPLTPLQRFSNRDEVDVSVSGSRWETSASPSLAHLIQRSAQDVPHPTDAHFNVGPYKGPMDAEFARMWDTKTSNEPRIGPLGSGSDYTVFLQRLGVASSDQGFGGTPTDAHYYYQSIYGSQMCGFYKHVAVAQHLGLLTLRLTDSIILPLNTTQYALELDFYVDTVIEFTHREEILPELCPLRRVRGIVP
ncbi:hypothetical protein P692DRAFT_20880874 [Suillus brevipes Sb2]|nr:hypothetical protein P692DRAFT_20880874 [Suillus brevipes Sb2]